MKRHFGNAVAASLVLCSIGCGAEDKSKPTDEGTDPVASQSFEACKKDLKPSCKYDDSETACSSLTTAVIPLTDGSTWGGKDLPQGPYGSYVEWNEGKDFANPINAAESSCALAAAIFGEPASVTADVLNLRGQDLSLYTVFRPACMKEGEKYPVITWGNGTCGQAGGYASLLATVASHGFVIFAANSRWTGAGNKEMNKALDFAEAANNDASSPLYHKLDLDNIGAMGHSQGAGATVAAAVDPRIKSLILWNGGKSSNDKPFLSISGERDIGATTVESMTTDIANATKPGAWLYYHKVLLTGGNVTGHLTLMEQPERVTEPAIAWWKYQLKGDAEAKKMFVGAGCGLCDTKAEFEFGQRDLP